MTKDSDGSFSKVDASLVVLRLASTKAIPTINVANENGDSCVRHVRCTAHEAACRALQQSGFAGCRRQRLQ